MFTLSFRQNGLQRYNYFEKSTILKINSFRLVNIQKISKLKIVCC